ncbi:MAG: AbrB/MazE/SpoVT family DNA-binding domain-containing protein [Nanoarchaeota archaeon]
MVELRVRLGSKGQVVIPKILRDYYKMFPKEEVIIIEQKEGVLIKRDSEDPIEMLKKIAEKINEKKKIKVPSAKELKETFYEQYEERTRRAGIRI